MSAYPKARGFTLIELLVVIAIIAILAAILFPVFITARQNASLAKCQSHQKELVQALMMYTDTWNGRLPWIQFLTYHDFGGTLARYPWVHMVRLYEPYVKNFNILLCPQKYYDTYYREVRHQGYAYNECLCGRLSDRPIKTGRLDVYFIADRDGRLLASIPRVSKTPVFFCAMSFHPAPGDYGPNGWGWEPVDALNPMRMTNAHRGGSNYSFLDGHVRWLKPAGGGVYNATDGLDYDGNGTVGDAVVLR
jgi:prepilin-type N-terminal cleavage/methylation domain-containing protein/prepilin-type processing-associated H-X9-DG protein